MNKIKVLMYKKEQQDRWRKKKRWIKMPGYEVNIMNNT